MLRVGFLSCGNWGIIDEVCKSRTEARARPERERESSSLQLDDAMFGKKKRKQQSYHHRFETMTEVIFRFLFTSKRSNSQGWAGDKKKENTFNFPSYSRRDKQYSIQSKDFSNDHIEIYIYLSINEYDIFCHVVKKKKKRGKRKRIWFRFVPKIVCHALPWTRDTFYARSVDVYWRSWSCGNDGMVSGGEFVSGWLIPVANFVVSHSLSSGGMRHSLSSHFPQFATTLYLMMIIIIIGTERERETAIVVQLDLHCSQNWANHGFGDVLLLLLLLLFLLSVNRFVRCRLALEQNLEMWWLRQTITICEGNLPLP